MDLHRWYEGLLARFEDDAIDRRVFLGALGKAAILCGVAGTGVAGFIRNAKAAGAIRVDAFGGLTQKALNDRVFVPFSKETGATVNQGSYGETDQLLAKLQADPPGTYNAFVSTDPTYILRFQQLELIGELDDKKIPRLSILIDRPVRDHRVFSRNGSVTAIPYSLSGRWIGYDADKVDVKQLEAAGAAILIDPKLTGQIVSENEWSRRIWYAALQSGQNPNAIKNMDAVWDKIRESKQVVKKFWTSASESTALFKNREAIIGDTRLTVVQGLKKDGLHFEGWPSKAISIGFTSLAALRGTPMDLFYEMVNVLLRPEVMIAIAVDSGNLSPIKPEGLDLPEAFKQLPCFDPAGKMEEGYNTLDPAYWVAHAEEWQRKFSRVMARG